MRFVFFMLTIWGFQVIHAQDVDNCRVPVWGLFFEIFDKNEITNYYANQYRRFIGEKSFSLMIDFDKDRHMIISESGERTIHEEVQNGNIFDKSSRISSNIVYIYPESRDAYMFENCGFDLPNLNRIDFMKKSALELSPWYEFNKSNNLFKCFYFIGTAFKKNIDEMDQEWVYVLLGAYALGNLKNKKCVYVIDDIQTYTPYMMLEYSPIWIPFSDSTQ